MARFILPVGLKSIHAVVDSEGTSEMLTLCRRAATVLTGTTAAGAIYLQLKTTIKSPIPADDGIWSSREHALINPNGGASMNDITTKTVPLRSIRPDLIKRENSLTLEFCRGIWSGWGYAPQRLLLNTFARTSETASQLWTPAELVVADYSTGTKINDMFEVLETTHNTITVWAGDLLSKTGPREADGLLVISATIIEPDNSDNPHEPSVELSLKSND